MGTQWPHALIVTGPDDKLQAVYEAATVELGHRSKQLTHGDLTRYLTPCIGSQFNSDATFAVLPCDSKLGWPPEEALADYREWLTDYIDADNRATEYVAIDYVHVSFAHDDREPRTETAKILAETVYDEWDEGESVMADPEPVTGHVIYTNAKNTITDLHSTSEIITPTEMKFLAPRAVTPNSLAAEVTRLGRELADALRRIEALEAREKPEQ